MDNVSLKGGAEPDVYKPDTGPRVRVNMSGYLPKGPKNATLVTDETEAVGWKLRKGAEVVATGTSIPRGVDGGSGQNVHVIDFGSFTTPGTGYTLEADGETSRPFDLDGGFYERLRTDALNGAVCR
ncbi:hypothetical protein FHR32_001609 [Streptosporangium album]|uniref:Cellulase Ig-like domain-containing protein n=1 Tax=Streptosporangium album TaxID=47479 RepID=A0A7W7W8P4_9ACTN|nr:cellulase N-terminal Ig-like domain-containing protein [Streptosporangium album]MBB4937304.1 hypothetical protein [Streptosporangium album]